MSENEIELAAFVVYANIWADAGVNAPDDLRRAWQSTSEEVRNRCRAKARDYAAAFTVGAQ